eukprot:284816452_3
MSYLHVFERPVRLVGKTPACDTYSSLFQQDSRIFGMSWRHDGLSWSMRLGREHPPLSYLVADMNELLNVFRKLCSNEWLIERLRRFGWWRVLVGLVLRNWTAFWILTGMPIRNLLSLFRGRTCCLLLVIALLLVIRFGQHASSCVVHERFPAEGPPGFYLSEHMILGQVYYFGVLLRQCCPECRQILLWRSHLLEQARILSLMILLGGESNGFMWRPVSFEACLRNLGHASLMWRVIRSSFCGSDERLSGDRPARA